MGVMGVGSSSAQWYTLYVGLGMRQTSVGLDTCDPNNGVVGVFFGGGGG